VFARNEQIATRAVVRFCVTFVKVAMDIVAGLCNVGKHDDL